MKTDDVIEMLRSRIMKLSRRRLLVLGAAGAAGAGVTAVGIARRRPDDPEVRVMPVAPPVRIDDVTVIDPRDGSRRPASSVHLRDGRITEVTGALSGTPPQPGVTVVDGGGRFVVPGYADMHTHTLQAERPRVLLATMIAEGVTGFRQMAGSPDLLRHRAEFRLPLGAGTPGLLAMPGELLMPFNAGSADEARAEIDRQREQGADFAKLVLFDREVFLAAVRHARERGIVTAGHLPPGVSPDEAADAGFTCTEHFGTGNNIWLACAPPAGEQAASALPVPPWVLGLPFAKSIFTRVMETRLVNPAAYEGEDAVAQMRRVLDAFDETRARELAERLARTGTWQVPTLVRLRTQWRADDPAYATDPLLGRMSPEALDRYTTVRDRFAALPAATRETYRLAYDTALRLTRIFHDAGVPMMTGTDGGGVVPGQSMREEFAELARAGLPPLSILRAATSAPATFLGRPQGAGAEADLLLLDADPLEGHENLTTIHTVVRAGHVISGPALARAVTDAGQ
jgi:hypothetical protein